MRSPSLGPLVKAVETLKVFASSAPSPRELLANRRRRFERLHAVLPSTATPGERLSLTVQAWDQCERLHRGFDGTATVETTDPDATHPDAISFAPADDGVVRRDGVAFGSTGTRYLALVDDRTGERFVSNPVRVRDEFERRTYWGDIHLHSALSDGTGTVEEGYRFGRDVMDLDVAAYTDHDTMGFFIPPGWQRARMRRAYFDRIRAAAEAFNDAGEFVTLPAYEWTQQPKRRRARQRLLRGRRRRGAGRLARPDFEHLRAALGAAARVGPRARLPGRDGPAPPRRGDVPVRLRERGLRRRPRAAGRGVLPVGVERAPRRGRQPVPPGDGTGGDRGAGPLRAGRPPHGPPGRDDRRLGLPRPPPGHSLIHARPHPPALREWLDGGLGWGNVWRVWNERSYPGGLAAVLAPELTRSAVMSALRSRSVYATTQPDRILVDFRVNGVDVARQDGAVTVADPGAPREIEVDVAGTAPVAAVEVVKNAGVWRTVAGTDDPDAPLDAYELSAALTDEAPLSGMSWDDARGTDGDAYTLRVRQASADRFPGIAWVGPVWVEAA